MSRPDDRSRAQAPAVLGMPVDRVGSGRTSRTWLQRLRLAGVVLPVVFVVALQLLRPVLIDVRWPHQQHGDLVVTAVTVLATVLFGIVMFGLIERAHAVVLRQNRELSAVNRVLVQVSQQDDPGLALATVVRLARSVPRAASAGLCLDSRTAASTAIGRGAVVAPTPDTPLCITGEGPDSCRCPDVPDDRDPDHTGPASHADHADHADQSGRQDAAAPRGCPGRHPTEVPGTVRMTLHGPDRPYGQIWVAPQTGARLGVQEEAFLSTLAELAVVALRHARLLDNERGAAIVAERDRIAREMHDSLAQVLGATHLRLRGLAARPDLADHPDVRDEVEDVATTCHEAYADVREAILGLRASTRADGTFLDSLDAYVQQFSRQSRIPTRLEADTHELAFVPQCEVQVLRVVQEALTNVRKHSGASRAVVRVRGIRRATVLEVEDDGRGFDPEALPDRGQEGFGMASMRERAALVDGRLSVDSRPGEGTRVAVTIPGTMRLSRPGETGWGP